MSNGTRFRKRCQGCRKYMSAEHLAQLWFRDASGEVWPMIILCAVCSGDYVAELRIAGGVDALDVWFRAV